MSDKEKRAKERAEKAFAANKVIWNGAELLDQNITEIKWLVEDLIPKTCLFVVFGSSDLGKSSFLRQLAIDIILQMLKFLGLFKINAKHNRVLYISSEDDKTSVGYYLLKEKELDKENADYKNLIYMFTTENLLKEIRKFVIEDEHPVDLIVIDAFGDIFSGDINQLGQVRSQLNKFKELSDELECAIGFLHHSSKGSRNRAPSKHNLIGSQGLEAKARVVIELVKDPEDAKYRHMCIVKANYSPEEMKDRSYKLLFDEKLLFTFTGDRIPFSQLVKSAKDEEQEKELIELVTELSANGHTVREIEEIVAQRGFKAKRTKINRIQQMLGREVRDNEGEEELVE